ncbi:MAG TPA: DUF488 domain-containing protein [Actinomycetota bacterium]|nr:DUF488 domain-containing protein [Actinomycetota bacterium]
MGLFTIGHGTRSVDELSGILTGAGVTLLADVRRFPGSRRNPQLSRASLSEALPERGVRYEWWGESLGGRRSGRPLGGPPGGPPSRHPAWREPAFRAYADHMDSAEFRQALGRLLEVSSAEETAVMCSETLWWRCHRRLIADAAVLRGRPVVHLLSAGHAEPHPANPAMRRDEEGWPVYDVGVDRPLL